MQVTAALAQARRSGVDRLDAQLLMAHRLRCTRSWLIAHDDTELEPLVEQAFWADVQLRADGVPLAYLVGTREFHGLTLMVTPAVLVPRPETEHLVDWALERLAGITAPFVADLGTGSGAIALALARNRPDARVIASDRDANALDLAQSNARQLSLDLQWACGDWWAAFAGERFDLVVSNPPYIAADDPHLQALIHEPLQALTPGGDGLLALSQIIDGAPARLRSGAWLLLEHGHDQGCRVRTLLEQAGFADVETRRDLAGHERCSGGRWPRP